MPAGSHQSYWKSNLKYLAMLLSIWLIVSAGLSIVFADWLDQVRLGGFKLGFWFSQQGSILVFVVLIFVYARLMNRLDRRHDVDDRREDAR